MNERPDERTLTETQLDEIVDRPRGGKSNVILDSQILTSLMGCPRLSDFRFNHNFTSINGKSNSLECGSIVHAFMKYFYKAIINGVKRNEAAGFGLTAAQLYIKGCPECTDFHSTESNPRPSCNHKTNEFPGVINTPKEPDKDNPRDKYKTGWSFVLKTCEEYADFYKNDFWVPLEVDTVKQELLYEDDEVRILWKAQIDWLGDTNQGIFPMDHKTMKQRRDNISLNNQFIGQCLVNNTRRVFLDKVGFQTSLEPKEKFTRPPITYSASRLIEWQSETLPYYAKLMLMYAESGHWPPNYTHCETKYGTCAFLDVCSSEPNLREEAIRNQFIIGTPWDIKSSDDE